MLTVTCVFQGNLVAVGTHKGLVQIWDAAAGKKLSVLEGHTARVGECGRVRMLFLSVSADVCMRVFCVSQVRWRGTWISCRRAAGTG